MPLIKGYDDCKNCMAEKRLIHQEFSTATESTDSATEDTPDANINACNPLTFKIYYL